LEKDKKIKEVIKMDGSSTAAGGFLSSLGTAAAGVSPIGWVMAGLGVVNYFSARKRQKEMQDRLRPIAQEQMGAIKAERKDITSEYSQLADSARKMGDTALNQMYMSRGQAMRKSQVQMGQAALSYGSGNLQADNLLTAYNQQMGTRAEQTTQQVVGVQNRLASELRGLDASALQLKSMYAQQGIGLGYNMTNIDQYKYV